MRVVTTKMVDLCRIFHVEIGGKFIDARENRTICIDDMVMSGLRMTDD
jgi:hypothetical protein